MHAQTGETKRGISGSSSGCMLAAIDARYYGNVAEAGDIMPCTVIYSKVSLVKRLEYDHDTYFCLYSSF